MAGNIIIPKGSPPPLAPYSPGMRVGNTIYVSGTLAMNAKGEVVGIGDVSAQTEQVIQNIRDVLEAAGSGLRDVLMANIFLTDFSNYEEMNKTYGKYKTHRHIDGRGRLPGLERRDPRGREMRHHAAQYRLPRRARFL